MVAEFGKVERAHRKSEAKVYNDPERYPECLVRMLARAVYRRQPNGHVEPLVNTHTHTSTPVSCRTACSYLAAAKLELLVELLLIEFLIEPLK